MAPDPRSVVHRLGEALHRGDLDAAAGLLAEEAVEHGPPEAPVLVVEALRELRAAFPDADLVQESLVASGELVVERFTLTGTHRATFQGRPATGRLVRLRGVNVYRVAGERVVERWAALDEEGLVRQLGTPPRRGTAEAAKA